MVVALAIGIFALPPALLHIGTERARTCFARVEHASRLPDCDQAAAPWFWLPARAPWTRRPAEQSSEELSARMAMARYVDAAVGTPDATALADRFAATRQAWFVVVNGTARLRFDALGPSHPAPEPGVLAFETGDRRTLTEQGLRWTQWYTSSRAMEATLLEGNIDRGVRLAEHYAGRPNSDLRVDVAALSCIGGDFERGRQPLLEVERDRAQEKSANFSRNFGGARVVVEGCALLERSVPNALPSYGNAGAFDHRAQYLALALRAAERRHECSLSQTDGDSDAVSACMAHEAVGATARTIVERLQTQAPLRYRLAQFAMVHGLVESAAQARTLVEPRDAEPLLDSPLAIDDWIARRSEQAPFVEPRVALGAARKLSSWVADAPTDDLLVKAATVLFVDAAASQIGRGLSGDAALSEASRGLSDTDGRLLRSTALHLRGKTAEAIAQLEPVVGRDPSRATSRALAQRALLRADGAAVTLALEHARAADDAPTIEKLRWLALALDLEPTGADEARYAAHPPARVDVLGPFTAPSEARRHDVDRALGRWRHWLAHEAERRAIRYLAFRHRGDMPAAHAAYLHLGARLLEQGDVEVWLDAFGALDARRMSLRAYAFARAEAARLRADEDARTLWAERYRKLSKLVHDPDAAELYQTLRL